MVRGNEDFLDEVLGEVDDEIDEVFAQEVLWETGRDLSFSDNDHSVNLTALRWLPKILSTSIIEIAYLICGLIDDLEASRKGNTEAEKDVDRQKGFVSAAEKSASDALNYESDLRKRVAALSRRETELSANDTVTLSRKAKATAEYCAVEDFEIELRRECCFPRGQLKEISKGKLAKSSAVSTRIGMLLDSTRVTLGESQKKLAVKYVAVRSVFQYS